MKTNNDLSGSINDLSGSIRDISDYVLIDDKELVSGKNDLDLEKKKTKDLPLDQNPYVIFGQYTEKFNTIEKEILYLKGNSDKYIKKDWKAVGVVLGTISVAGLIVWSVINVWVLGRVKNSECKQEAIYLYNAKITNLKEFQKSYSDCSTK
jgi:hypothetical protein